MVSHGRKVLVPRLLVMLAGLLAGIVPGAAQPPIDAWPMQGHDAQRTGRSTVSGPRTLALKWFYDLGTWAGSYPALAQDNDSPIVAPDGTIVVPATTALYAVNPDGSFKWKRDFTGGGNKLAPALSPNGATVYYLDDDGNGSYVRAASTATGEVNWSLGLLPWGSWSSYSSLAVDAAGTVYLANIGGPNTTGHVWAVNPGGTEKWHWDSPCGNSIGIEAPVAVDSTGNVFFSHNVCGVYALDNTGNFKWNYPDIGDYGWPTPTVGPDGTVYFAGDHDGQETTTACTALRPDGTLKWIRTDIGHPGWFAGMAISGDGSTVYTARSGGKLYALDAQTGATVWSSILVPWGDEFGGSPVLAANNTIYVMGTDGTVFAADSTNGTVLWNYETNSGSFYWGPPSPALGPDGTLYVLAPGRPPALGNLQARLYAFHTAPPGSAPGMPSTPTPWDFQTGVVSFTLSWIAGSGANSYDVYFGTAATPPFVGNTVTTGYDAGTLSPSTTYYWRVEAKNIYGTTSSQTWTFTTGTTPTVPGSPSPANGAKGVSVAPTLSWSAATGAISYDVYFGTDAAPPLAGSVSNPSYSPGTLNPGATYYWKVVARNPFGTASSPVWSFNTPPTVPANPSPGNGATSVSVSATLSWSASAGATSYDVYFGQLSNPPLAGNVTTPGYSPGALSPGETYYWKVVAKSASDSASSPVWSFTTGAAPSPAPGNPSPALYATEVTVTPTLQWSASTGATSYDVYFGTGTPSLVGNVTTLSFSPGALNAGTTYYWKVVAKNAFGSTSSPDWSFRTGEAPSAPFAPAPSYGATGIPVTTTLGWIASTGATSYDVYFGTAADPPLAGNVTTNSYPVSGLNASTTYYWKVVAKNAFGSTSSPVWHFTTGAAPSPAPGSPSPANAATGVALTPTLGWSASTGATSYDVYFGIAADPPLAGNVTTTTWPAGALAASTTYYWKVVAKNAFGSTSSLVWSFRTGDAPGVVNDEPGPATLISALPFQTTQDTRQATSNLADPVHSCRSGSQDAKTVWFRYVANFTGTLQVNTFGSNYDTVLTAYQGAATTGAEMACSDDANGGLQSAIEFAVVSGQTYFIEASAWGSGEGGTLVLAAMTSNGSLRFVAVTPCRVADTRNPVGPFGGPAIAGNTSRDFAILAGSCGIPSNALAYSFNVTVVPSASLLYLSMWPTGQPLPVVSTLNALDGRWTANAAIVPAGTNGSVSVFVSDTTHVVLDINGYFVPAATSGALAFYPLTPCRVVDTRSGASIAAGGTRTVPVRSSACSVPSAAVAYSLNFTALPHGPLGWITTWPTGAAMPTASTLNAPTGTITANAAILPAGASGSVDVYASDATDLLVDINGYFAPPGTGGLSFYTLTPCRVADTRNADGPFGGPALVGSRDFAVPASACGVPSGAQAYSLNATVWPATGFLNWLTLWPEGGAMPVVSTLNSWDGRLVANAAIVPTTNGSISAYASDLTTFIFDINGYFAP